MVHCPKFGFDTNLIKIILLWCSVARAAKTIPCWWWYNNHEQHRDHHNDHHHDRSLSLSSSAPSHCNAFVAATARTRPTICLSPPAITLIGKHSRFIMMMMIIIIIIIIIANNDGEPHCDDGQMLMVMIL